MESRCTGGALQIQRLEGSRRSRELWVLYVAELPRTAADRNFASHPDAGGARSYALRRLAGAGEKAKRVLFAS